MANTVAVGITAQDDGFKQSLSQMAASASKFAREIGASGKGVQSLNGSFRTAKKAVMDLSLAYSQLSEEAKNSDFGQVLAAQLEQAKQTAAELQDMRGDISEQIKNMASDTKHWDAAKEGIGVLSSGLQGLASAYGLVGGNCEAFQRALVAVNAVQSIANTIINIGNALQKQSALMTELRAAKENILGTTVKAETAAEIANTAAVSSNTASVKTNEVAIESNKRALMRHPIGLIATILATVTAAILVNSEAWQKLTGSIDESQAEMFDADAELDKQRQTVERNSMMLEILRNKWNQLGDDMDAKRKFIKLNADEFHRLGIRANTVNGVESALVKNANTVIKMWDLKARAAAAYAEQQYYLGKQIEEVARVEERAKNGDITREELKKYYKDPGSLLPVGYMSTFSMGGLFSADSETYKVYGQALDDLLENVKLFGEYAPKLQKINNNIKEIETEILNLKWENAETFLDDASDATNRVGKTTKNTTKQVEKQKTALEKLEEEIKKTETAISNLNNKDEHFEDNLKSLNSKLADLKVQKLKFIDITTIDGLMKARDLMTDIKKLIPETDKRYKDLNEVLSNTENKLYDILSALLDSNEQQILEAAQQEVDKIIKTSEYGTEEWKKWVGLSEKFASKLSEIKNETDYIKKNASLNNVIANIDNIRGKQDENKLLASKEAVIKVYLELFNEKEFEKRYDELLNSFKNTEVEPRIKKQALDEVEKAFSEKFELFSTGLIDYDTLKNDFDEVINYLNSKGIDTTSLTESFSNAIQDVDLNNAFKDIQIGGDVSTFVDNLKIVKTRLEEVGVSSREVFNILHQAGTNAFNELQQQYDEGLINAEEFRNKCNELAKILKEELGIEIEVEAKINAPKWKESVDIAAGAVSSLGDAMSSIAQATDDEGLAVAGIITKAIANVALAAATASAKASETGNPWVWLGFSVAAMAEMAAAIASIHSATGMAEGGIVQGSTTMGDKIVTRLNAGEMVLNRKQQSNLFNALDNGISESRNDGPQVSTVRIKGSDIYLALKNYGKVTNKKL